MSEDRATVGDVEDLRRQQVAFAERVNGWYELEFGGGAVLLHPVIDMPSGGVACGCKKGASCPSKGKHPVRTGWESAEPEPADSFGRGSATLNANVGARTGRGLLVVDLDVRDGKDGEGDWRRLMQAAGVGMKDLRTFTMRTGSGGIQLYFRIPPGADPDLVAQLRNRAHLVDPATGGADGIDLRWDGGQVVGAGSRNDRGAYSILRDRPVIDLPAAMLAEIVGRLSTRKSATTEAPVVTGELADAAQAEREFALARQRLDQVAYLAEGEHPIVDGVAIGWEDDLRVWAYTVIAELAAAGYERAPIMMPGWPQEFRQYVVDKVDGKRATAEPRALRDAREPLEDLDLSAGGVPWGGDPDEYWGGVADASARVERAHAEAERKADIERRVDEELRKDEARRLAEQERRAARREQAPPLFADLTQVTTERPRPAWLRRADGACALYTGRVHFLFGDSEAGKSWVALAACVEVLEQGGKVWYLDSDHNGADELKGRLVAMGVAESVVNDPERLRYTDVEDHDHTLDIVEAAIEWGATLVVVDSLGESLSLGGFNPNVDDDVFRFNRQVLVPMARAGVCVVVVDHQAKNAESRAHGATGATAKRRSADGTMLEVARVREFAPGKGGASRLRVFKDRPGGVRQFASDRDFGLFELIPGQPLAEFGEEDESLSWRILEPLGAEESGTPRSFVVAVMRLLRARDEAEADPIDGIPERGWIPTKALCSAARSEYGARFRNGEEYEHLEEMVRQGLLAEGPLGKSIGGKASRRWDLAPGVSAQEWLDDLDDEESMT